FTALPDTIATLTAEPIIRKLKSRRDDLPRIAQNYYNTLARQVQVVGSDKHERFEVEVTASNDVLVRMYKTLKDGEPQQLLLERVLHPSETTQLTLYGLNGDDTFVFKGNRKPPMKIKVWGGAGEDQYRADNTAVAKRLYIYDTLYRNSLHVPKQAHVDLDNDQKAQNFDAEGWLLRYYLD
ncbi:MAG: hypothetical protein LPK03_15545, partial [Pontibacter sp.]|nr:hypothetical protein [Pontibacter sp.]